MRRQFLVPLAITMLVIAVAISGIAWFASKDLERRWMSQRMDTVFHQLNTASYPLTPNVIEQIKSLSGVEVLLLAADGSMGAATLPRETIAGEVVPSLIGNTTAGTVRLGARPFRFQRYKLDPSLRDREFGSMVLLVEDRGLQATTWPMRWAPIASGVISLLAMALVTTYVATRLVRRIERLESQVGRIAEGHYDTLPLRGPNDAIRRLSGSINSLCEELAVAKDWIARTERSRLITMIAGGMAHQLRNAITGASLLVQSFLRSSNHPPPQELIMAEHQLRLATESVRRLLASDPNVEMADEPEMSVDAIQHAIAGCVSPYAVHQHVRLVWVIPSEARALRVPQGAAVTGALVNLLMNAIEAAGSNGDVRCELATASSDKTGRPRLVWRVSDNGPGPSPDVASSMMEPFVSSKKEGIGLGLPMARRVAERCHGSLQWSRLQDRTVFEMQIMGEV